eukprot:s822_g19.t1
MDVLVELEAAAHFFAALEPFGSNFPFLGTLQLVSQVVWRKAAPMFWPHRGVAAAATEAAVVGGITAAVVTRASQASQASRASRVPLPAQQVVVLPYQGQGVGMIPPIIPRPAVLAQAAPIARANAADANLQPLGVCGVRLPAAFLEERASVRFFAIDVMSEEGRAWRVMRRFNDFWQLKEQLGPSARKLPGAPFPRKLLFACSGDKLEQRREQLELWLGSVVQQPRADWIGVLRVFLQTGRQMIDFPTPPAEDRQALEAVQDWRVEIEVPSHVSAGQLLAVSLPDGRSLNFTVPKGVCGSKIELKYNPSQKTLELA